MRKLKLFVIIGLAALGIYFLALSMNTEGIIKSAMTVADAAPVVTEAPVTPPPKETEVPDDRASIIPTTISGGMVIKNATSYNVDVSALLNEGCPIRLQADKPQILIIHTHSSEAYSPAGLDKYEDSGASRTQDNNYNVIRIGDELTKIFESCGLNVIHDRGVYDYPSYTGSYNRSGAAIEKYLSENPSIAIVIDLHRDALGSKDVTYKTVATESGVCASQIMIFIGTDGSGLEHPRWRENLRFGLYLQNAVISEYPSLMRPVQLVSYRYNQHLTTGSMILEVGSNGNTLQEALAAIRLFGKAAGPALAVLVE